jgi:hypothetical protein
VTARYYAVKPDSDGAIRDWLPDGPHPTYDETVKIHAQEISANPPRTFPPPPPMFERRVLLDVSSVATCDEQEMMLLLLTDPMLHAVFVMGRRAGQESTEEQYKAEGR